MTEVVIVVAIVAILAAVAYPSYSAHKVRANRAAAQAVLMDLASRQQQYFIDARGYSSDLTALGYGSPNPNIASVYTVDAPAVDNTATPPTFALTASPKSGTIQTNDGQLRVTSAGVKTRGGTPW
jgi:type IV pilus assembly protein PilE